MVGARTRSRRSSAVDPSCWSSSRQRLTGMTCRCHSLLAWSQGQSPPNRFSRRRNTAKIRFGWPAAGEVPDPPAVVADPRTWNAMGLCLVIIRPAECFCRIRRSCACSRPSVRLSPRH